MLDVHILWGWFLQRALVGTRYAVHELPPTSNQSVGTDSGGSIFDRYLIRFKTLKLYVCHSAKPRRRSAHQEHIKGNVVNKSGMDILDTCGSSRDV